jgi:hypothetical protein
VDVVVRPQPTVGAPTGVAEDEIFVTYALYAPTRKGLARISESGDTQLVNDSQGTALKLLDNELFLISRNRSAILVCGPTGKVLRTIPIPSEAVGKYLKLAIVPDGRLALMDNRNDKIYFTDNSGQLLTTVDIKDPADDSLQALDGVVVGDRLIVTEDGDKRLLQVDLSTYRVSVFRDFSHLPDPYLGSITYADGTYLLAGTTQVYQFTEGTPPTLLAQVPEGNITGLVVGGNCVYVSVNASGTIEAIDLRTGASRVWASGLDYPEGLVAVPIIPPGTVRGRVLWNEQPVSGATVYVAEQYDPTSQRHGTATTDKDGRFSIPGVPEGRKFLFAKVDQAEYWRWEVTPFQMGNESGTLAQDTYLCKGFDPTFPPNGGSIQTRRPTLQWNAYPDAATYSVTVHDRNGALVFFDKIAETSVTVDVELPLGSYTWEVYGYNAVGNLISCSLGPREFSVTD